MRTARRATERCTCTLCIIMAHSWSSGLFDCFNDINACLCVACCNCCAHGLITQAIAEKRGQGDPPFGDFGACFTLCCVPCVSPCVTMGNRTQLRMQHNLKEDPCGDFLTHCFCQPCAMCQEWRECKHQAGKYEAGGGPVSDEMER